MLPNLAICSGLNLLAKACLIFTIFIFLEKSWNTSASLSASSEWASWYSGQGEQDWFIWQGENGGIDGQTDSIENDDLTDKDIILNLRRK